MTTKKNMHITKKPLSCDRKGFLRVQ